MKWFAVGDRWHAWKPSRADTHGRCGLVALGDVETQDFDLYPTNPCHTCRLQVALDDAMEEPLTKARSRGVIPVPFALPDPEEPVDAPFSTG